MSEELSQEEADYLIGLEKRRTRNEQVRWPSGGGKAAVPLVSTDGREEFMLDIGTSSIKLTKLMLQNRARVTAVLVRLEIDGAPHRNPDDQEIPCPHIHLYREGFNDKWAFPIPPEHFRDLGDRRTTVEDFMRFCRIVQPPEFVEGLL